MDSASKRRRSSITGHSTAASVAPSRSIVSQSGRGRSAGNGLLLIDDGRFFLTDEKGDVVVHGTDGLFVADVRHLATWALLLNHEPLDLLTSRNLDDRSARIFGTLAGVDLREGPSVTAMRDRRIEGGVAESLVLHNHSQAPQIVEVELRAGSDWSDIFEIRDPPLEAEGAADLTRDGQTLRLSFQLGGWSRMTEITFSKPFEGEEATAKFHVELAPKSQWKLGIEITSTVDGLREPPVRTTPESVSEHPKPSVASFIERAPRLMTGDRLLAATYRQSLEDLACLRFSAPHDENLWVPAAGLPWFMALFGRDSLITAYQALPFAPDLARSTLKALAHHQAAEPDDFRDAEPGKILHELRRGKLASLGRIPHTPYYGTHDATPLWLILLDEYERWTGDTPLVNELRGPAFAALAWIEDHGDIDHDGYLEYESRSTEGLINHCWKDSRDSMVDARGRIAQGPIATSEIQGYAYDARVRTARLCRQIWGDEQRAARLEGDAITLKRAFNEDFWVDSRGHFALALDGNKGQVDSLTSNAGHLLWSGIVEPERAAKVSTRLMSPEMFNGWGLRTLAAGEVAYNPIGYHTGSIWPHDTGLAAEGMRRYGQRDSAARLLEALLSAAGYFEHRLPEVFAGFSRSDTLMPVEYPSASRPQAWAAGAPLLALRTMLNMDVADGQLKTEAWMTDVFGPVRLDGIMVGGKPATAP
ncbi:MAG: amylo-alpha-1,6-glucosidase [Actinomycetota bacterium]|nr:amylo-alpha-1,6-glucosidase [Actinomycetota bacterium]